MIWIPIDIKPSSYKNIILTDGRKCWIGCYFPNLDIFFATDADDRGPFVVKSPATHWMKLPDMPCADVKEV